MEPKTSRRPSVQMATPPLEGASPPVHPLVFMPALLLIALNLRPALSSLSTVLPEIMESLDVSATSASVLTMAPVLCLGLFGFITPRLSARFGGERMVLVALFVLAIGLSLRSVPVFASLLMGTVLAGAGIGIAGVLLPSLVKKNFPRHASKVTGFYTMGLCTGAAMAAGLTVPLARWLGGWWWGLACWALPALAAALLWSPQAFKRTHARHVPHERARGVWRSPLAWQVTLFMGLQSSLAYIVFGWLAPILRERGLDPVDAGWAVSLSVMIQAPAALGIQVLLSRRPAQSGVIVLLMLFMLISLLGLLYAPLSTIWYWIAILGCAQGSSFSLALSLLVLRAPDARVATELSGMTQSVGYTLASLGPLMVGLIHDWTGSWNSAGPLFVFICLAAALAGYGAGRDRYVNV